MTAPLGKCLGIDPDISTPDSAGPVLSHPLEVDFEIESLHRFWDRTIDNMRHCTVPMDALGFF